MRQGLEGVFCEDMNPSELAGKSWDKRIQKLRLKKYREEFNQFIAEGDRLIYQLIDSGLNPEIVFELDRRIKHPRTVRVEKERLERLSALESPGRSLAVFPKPEFSNGSEQRTEYFFDRIKDPGNLGTVLRTAAWFGIARIWCSPESVDPFNPKVVQASMGGVASVEIRTASAKDAIETWQSEGRTVFKTGMRGREPAVLNEFDRVALIFGSEGDGIQAGIEQMLDRTISIGRAEHSTMESLNLAISTGILMHVREAG